MTKIQPKFSAEVDEIDVLLILALCQADGNYLLPEKNHRPVCLRNLLRATYYPKITSQVVNSRLMKLEGSGYIYLQDRKKNSSYNQWYPAKKGVEEIKRLLSDNKKAARRLRKVINFLKTEKQDDQ